MATEVSDCTAVSERDIAMVFRSYALYPHMDGDENIRFPLERPIGQGRIKRGD